VTRHGKARTKAPLEPQPLAPNVDQDLGDVGSALARVFIPEFFEVKARQPVLLIEAEEISAVIAQLARQIATPALTTW